MTTMSTIESITPTTAGYGDTAAGRIPQQTLGQEDFLKLLTAQFASQDPLKPMEDTEFIAQMANFSSLEIMSDLSVSMASLSSTQQLSAAQSLLGKSVELLDTTGTPVSGPVTSVRTDDGNTLITVSGREYDFNSVRRIQLNEMTNNAQP